MAQVNEFLGTGRRKTSVARVRVRAGSGKILINDREMIEYFPCEKHQAEVLAALQRTEKLATIDVIARCDGGGPSGQAGAMSLGIARALKRLDPSLDTILRPSGLLTRDSRMVERKKYGHKKARKSFQFSKR